MILIILVPSKAEAKTAVITGITIFKTSMIIENQ